MNDKVHSQAVRFSEDSLAGLDARTRSILSIDGLPTANPVFSAEPSGVEVTQAVPKAGDLVCLGESLNGDGAQIGLRIDAGTVVEYRPEFSDAIYVSESIEKVQRHPEDIRHTFGLPHAGRQRRGTRRAATDF